MSNTFEIHFSKLLEWLIEKKFIVSDWEYQNALLRTDLQATIEATKENLETNSCKSTAHYFEVKLLLRQLELVEGTKAKNMFGQYTIPYLQKWGSFCSKWEVNNLYIADGSQQLIRKLLFERPYLTRSLSTSEKDYVEFSRRALDYERSVQSHNKRVDEINSEWKLTGDVLESISQRLQTHNKGSLAVSPLLLDKTIEDELSEDIYRELIRVSNSTLPLLYEQIFKTIQLDNVILAINYVSPHFPSASPDSLYPTLHCLLLPHSTATSSHKPSIPSTPSSCSSSIDNEWTTITPEDMGDDLPSSSSSIAMLPSTDEPVIGAIASMKSEEESHSLPAIPSPSLLSQPSIRESLACEIKQLESFLTRRISQGPLPAHPPSHASVSVTALTACRNTLTTILELLADPTLKKHAELCSNPDYALRVARLILVALRKREVVKHYCESTQADLRACSIQVEELRLCWSEHVNSVQILQRGLQEALGPLLGRTLEIVGFDLVESD